MLPDFIIVKEKISKYLTNYLRNKVRNSDPFLKEIRQKVQHEGDRIKMKTYDGFNDEIEYKTLASEFKINVEEIIKEGTNAFIKHIDKLAEDILGQQAQIVFKKLNEITSKTGNTVDAQNSSFTKEKVLEALDKIEMEFDSEGKPANLTIVMHPDLWNKIKDQVPSWEQDSDFVKKRNEIYEKKRREWLDRENNRKLVD